jgi:tetratricopeptide (TPR) repeat protein
MKKLVILLCMAIGSTTLPAQKTITYTHPDKMYYDGREMYDLKQYTSAFRYFDSYLQDKAPGERNPYYSEAEYYIACSAYYMGRADAYGRLTAFCSDFPVSPHNNQVHLMQGILLCERAKYMEAADALAQCDPKAMDKNDRAEYYFRYGFSQLQLQNYDQARNSFNQIDKNDSRYGAGCQYYAAYIDYQQQKYDDALPVFLQLQSNPAYSDIVPYYIAQIYYAKGMNDKVLEYGLDIVAKHPDNENNAEIFRLIGESYFQKKDYDNTIKYLGTYEQRVARIYRNDVYMLGVAMFSKGQYKEAAERLQKVTAIGGDALTQNAYLYLGSCDLKLNDKNGARLAFEAASNADFDRNVKEEALYNYALVVYDQSYSPFNESVTAFERFLNEFPDSKYTESVYDYLVNVYLTTKNYAAAYASIQKIKKPSARIVAARQRVLYCLGIQQFNIGNMDSCITYMTQSIADRKSDYDIEAQSLFWRGEAYYRTGKYTQAEADLEDFLGCTGAHATNVFNLAHYDMGYCDFSQKKYAKALQWFRKYVNLESANKTLIADANNRIGDCYFAARDLSNAEQSYAKVYALNGPGADYACYQRAFIQGLQKNYDGKISTLKKMLQSYPQSEFRPDAMYEIGRSYVMLNKNEKAIAEYNELNKQYYHHPLAAKARLQTAMLYDEMNEYDAAIKTYKQIVDLSPNSDEAKTALDGLKQIYFEKNDVQGYADYVSTLGGLAQFSATEQDSLTFLAAEKVYMKSDWANAIKSLQNYTSKYPNSVFKVNAHYEIAQSYRKLQDTTNAIKEFAIVAAMPGNWQATQALIHLSDLQYGSHDYQSAAASYKQLLTVSQKADIRLKALTGTLHCYNKLAQYDSTINAATALISSPSIDPAATREAYYLRAKAYEKNNTLDKALADYKVLSTNCMDEYGAEAEYRVAEYGYHNGDAAGAEKEIFAFIDKNTPHQYWLAKAFVLLSDIYISQGKDFDAKQYLLSLKENYKDNAEINTEIKARLDDINNREAKKVKK